MTSSGLLRKVAKKLPFILRKLGACRQQDPLHLKLGEISCIERKLFMLNWIKSADLRVECQAGLTKGEALVDQLTMTILRAGVT